jgi:hypothetical protein
MTKTKSIGTVRVACSNGPTAVAPAATIASGEDRTDKGGAGLMVWEGSTRRPNLIHFFGNGVISTSSQPVDAGSHQKIRSNLPSGTKKLINIGFPVPDMDAPSGIIEIVSGRGMLHEPTRIRPI